MFEQFNPDEVLRVIDNEGAVISKDLEPKLTKKQLEEMYYLMVLAKAVDEKIVSLQRQGRMGTYGQSRGQEAVHIGSAYAMEKKDWLFPAFRELGAHLTRGISIEANLLNWKGSEEGEYVPKDVNDFTFSIPVASQIPHAVGAAMAAQIKGDKIAVVVYFGDGATSEGDFHEGLNFAGVFHTPNVFICQNNQYAISTPRERQTASKTLAQKALAYGFNGIVVDGNDVLAMYAATMRALDHARSGKGPVLIEAQTYRFGPHTTADDPTRYRDKAELEEWKRKDPILRFQKYLQKKKIWDKQFEAKIVKRVGKELSDAVKHVEEIEPPETGEMFDYVYETLPHHLEEQKKYVLEMMKDG